MRNMNKNNAGDDVLESSSVELVTNDFSVCKSSYLCSSYNCSLYLIPASPYVQVVISSMQEGPFAFLFSPESLLLPL